MTQQPGRSVGRTRAGWILILTLLLAACGFSGDGSGATESSPVLAAERPAATSSTSTTRERPSSADTAAPTTAPQTETVLLDEVPQPTTDLEATLISLYEQANPSVVYVVVPQIGSGSGFVIDGEGHIVTNYHVVSGGQSYEIVFAGGERRRATLVGSDADSDLAVLQVDDMPAGVEPLTLAAPDSVRVGQFVVTIGNPFGEQGSMSLGIVSGLGRSLPSQRSQSATSSYALPRVIQTDAPINPGNSGGPLLNLAGQVVGVNAAIATATGTSSGVGFSIPAEALRRIVPTLISEGLYHYPYMGAAFDSELSLDEQSLYDVPQTLGAYVLSVNEQSPAAGAGLRGADPVSGRGGDLIVALDGREIRSFADLNAYLVFNTSVGQTIEMTVLRDGATLTLPLTLGERP